MSIAGSRFLKPCERASLLCYTKKTTVAGYQPPRCEEAAAEVVNLRGRLLTGVLFLSAFIMASLFASSHAFSASEAPASSFIRLSDAHILQTQTRVLDVYATDRKFGPPVTAFTSGQEVWGTVIFIHPGGPVADNFAVVRRGRLLSPVCRIASVDLPAGEWLTTCLVASVPPLRGTLWVDMANRHLAQDLPFRGILSFSDPFSVGPSTALGGAR